MDNNMQKREEDRVRSAQVKKQRRRFRLFTVVALTLAWVLLLICVILLVWNRWEARKQKKEQDAIETVAEVQEILYSQEEVDALVA
ncbi:MAG: hypothetical protein IJ833_06250 [Lachnospiraceae bacterium]|nr:hypothetical protein [Lachnospiraceae bacterium]